VPTKLAIKKPKLLRSNPFRLSSIRYQGLVPSEVLIDDEDLISSTRRPRVVHDQINDDDELSDYVKARLLTARILAMKKYHEIWG
jgi:hypothetical protein